MPTVLFQKLAESYWHWCAFSILEYLRKMQGCIRKFFSLITDYSLVGGEGGGGGGRWGIVDKWRGCGSSRQCISLYFSASGPDLFHINSRPKLNKYLTKQLLYSVQWSSKEKHILHHCCLREFYKSPKTESIVKSNLEITWIISMNSFCWLR